jgi:multiple sugar transport system permease protein
MSTGLLYLAGSIGWWIGIIVLLSGIYRFAVLAWFRSPDAPESTSPIQSLVRIAIGVAITVCGHLLTVPANSGQTVRIPMAWPVMPVWCWAITGIGFIAVQRLGQAATAINPTERTERLKTALTWVLVGTAVWALGKEVATPGFEVMKGGIETSISKIAMLLVVAVVATVAMAAVSRSTVAAGRAKGAATQIALISGSVLFGLPFLFLIITSFKEDRDMSSANGIVWVPKVQQKVAYFDPKNPLFESRFEGKAVEGTIIEKLPDGTVRIDISKPLSIRGTTIVVPQSEAKEIPRNIPLVSVQVDSKLATGKIIENFEDGKQNVEFITPAEIAGKSQIFAPSELEPIRNVGLRWENYSEALSFMPPETLYGLVYLKNSLLLVILSVLGTVLSSALVAYAFSRLKFPGREFLFGILLSTLMLPAAVTLLPQFLIFKQLGWVDTLMPLWVPAFFGSAFNIFLLRQFFKGIPMELEDASKIDGCSYLRTFWSVLMPQIKPALTVVAIWTALAAWNNFMGPLIYINSPENMPLSYALQLFQGDRGLSEPGLLMAFATMTMVPVLALFFFAQKYFIEGVTLSGLGGR